MSQQPQLPQPFILNDALVALANRLRDELAEERYFAELDETACTEDICERDFGYCKWCGRGQD